MPSVIHRPRKRFGQHFLRDLGTIRRILQAIQPSLDQHLVEIGPGLGAITRPLLEIMGRLDAVELDRDVIPHLQNRCQGRGKLCIYNADALVFDFSSLRQDERRLRLVGNLPYNISTPLLFHLLEQITHIDDMHFMLQREVAERMAATPNQARYGRLSVILQYRCQIQLLFTVNPAVFSPPPKVESAFVRLLPHDHPPVHVTNEVHFTTLIRQLFSQRRKTLRNTLRPRLCDRDLEAIGIDPGLRPENLGLAEFAALSNCLG
jgi:16S rRNA (adenine1518-N6/adenine1519-N6)-dimethyltransferase